MQPRALEYAVKNFRTRFLVEDWIYFPFQKWQENAAKTKTVCEMATARVAFPKKLRAILTGYVSEFLAMLSDVWWVVFCTS